jgi:hypothetical protein
VVVPTDFADTYTFTLEAIFETNVPLPVLLITPNVLDIPTLECSPYTIIQFNITNLGLIRADNVALYFPVDHPTLTFTQLVPLTAVDAKATVFVPVAIVSSVSDSCNKRSLIARDGGGGTGCFSANLVWSYPCGGEDHYSGAPIVFTNGSPCPGGDGGYGGGGMSITETRGGILIIIRVGWAYGGGPGDGGGGAGYTGINSFETIARCPACTEIVIFISNTLQWIV